jgi:ankyrin repeat protein
MVVALLAFAHYRRGQLQWELSSAARQGNLAVVERCVASGAEIDKAPISDAGGGSPALVAAAWDGHDDVIQFLLDHGASIDRRDSCDNTALNAALLHGHDSTARLLLSRGANPNIAGEGTPLSNAERNAPMVELLKSHGATRYPHHP